MEVKNIHSYTKKEIAARLKDNFPDGNCSIKDDVITLDLPENKFMVIFSGKDIFIDRDSGNGNSFIALIFGAVIFAVLKTIFGFTMTFILSIAFVIIVGVIQALLNKSNISEEDKVIMSQIADLISEQAK